MGVKPLTKRTLKSMHLDPDLQLHDPKTLNPSFLRLSGVLGGDVTAVGGAGGPIGNLGGAASASSSSWQSGSVVVNQVPFRQRMRAHERFHSVDDAGLLKVNRRESFAPP
eukprot:5333652-Amphidinium_carterae.1